MSGWLDPEPAGNGTENSSEGWPRAAGRILVACMTLLALAAGWLVLTRPVHRIEGDFLEREDRRVVDDWLGEQLESPIAETRARAYLALSRIEQRDALERLVQATHDPAPSVRAAAAFAIGNLLDSRLESGPAPDTAPNALVALLADEERIVATRSVEALGKMGWRSAAEDITRTAAPIATAMTALMRMESKGQSAFVVEYLDSDDQDSRWAAALAAEHLQIVREPAVWARLLPLVTDDNDFVRAAAIRAAGKGTADESLLAQIRTSLEHRDPKVRFEALAAIASLEGSPPADLPPVGEPVLDAGTVPAPDTRLLIDGDYQRVAKTLGSRLLMRTSLGEFEIELDYEQAPLSSDYFRHRSNAGALDGAVISAVRPNGYAVVAAPLGPIRSELNPKPFLRGSLGMLRQGDASGGGFFLCLTALPLTDSRYVNFGRLVSGDSLLDSIAPGATVLGVRELP